MAEGYQFKGDDFAPVFFPYVSLNNHHRSIWANNTVNLEAQSDKQTFFAGRA